MSCCKRENGGAAPGVARVAGCFAAGLVLLALGCVAAGSASATVIRVPEDRSSIDLAIADAGEGDTLSLAPGNYTRIPSAFVRRVVLRGRGASPEETILRGLRAGRARIENLTLRYEPGVEPDPALLVVSDSLTVVDCILTGAWVGVRVAAPDVAADSRIRLERCRFDNLLLGVELIATGTDGPRVEIVDGTFDAPINGVVARRTPESCAGAGTPPPPDIDASEALVRLSGCTFQDVIETAISISMLDNGLAAESTMFVRCGTPIALRLAGAALTSCTLTGVNRVGRGIDAVGARVDLSGCNISGFEYGIAGFPYESCRDSGGRLGPTPAEWNRLAGNSIALAGGSAFLAAHNFWGLLTCEDVNGLLEPTDTGSPRVGALLDEGGNAVADCSTAVESTTWGALKGRFAGPGARH